MKKIGIISAFFLLWFFVSDAIFTIKEEPLQPADIVIVLGNPANDDGSIGLTQKSRVDVGIELYKKGLAKKILFTGGAVANQHIESVVMKVYASSLGIPDNNIIIEPQSTNTIENAWYSFQIIKDKPIQSVIIVTSNYHTFRAKKIFDAYDITIQMKAAPYPKGLGFTGKLKAMLHEYAAWLYLLYEEVKFRITNPL